MREARSGEANADVYQSDYSENDSGTDPSTGRAQADARPLERVHLTTGLTPQSGMGLYSRGAWNVDCGGAA